jgi:hypothetical protein
VAKTDQLRKKRRGCHLALVSEPAGVQPRGIGIDIDAVPGGHLVAQSRAGQTFRVSATPSLREVGIWGMVGVEARHVDYPVPSPRQHDFAKRPILTHMAQGFARLAEGIDRSTIGLPIIRGRTSARWSGARSTSVGNWWAWFDDQCIGYFPRMGLRVQVGEITIRADRPGESTKIASADQLPLVDQLAVWAAGRAAEKLFRRQLPVLASADDLENAFHLLASTGIRETPDVNAVLDGGRARARELLREHETTAFDEWGS